MSIPLRLDPNVLLIYFQPVRVKYCKYGVRSGLDIVWDLFTIVVAIILLIESIYDTIIGKLEDLVVSII